MSATYVHTKRKPGKAKLILRLLGVLYFLLLSASIVYLWLFTQDNFTTIAEFKISQQGSGGGSSGLLQLALPGMSDSGSSDSMVAIGYIDSSDLLLQIEKEYNLFDHFTAPHLDPVFRLSKKATLEDRLDYYRAKISAHFDKDSGLTVISVTTFQPALSKKIATKLLEMTESYVNVINQQIAEQQVGFIHSELDRAAKNVELANEELLKFQNQYNFVNPEESISAHLKTVEEMRMDVLKGEAELTSIERDSPNSPRIESIRSKIRSLNELIDVENAKLSGPEKDRLNQLLVQFKQLQLKLEFVTRLRAGSEMLLEKNRVDAISRTKFFTVIQNPYLPEDVSMPRRPYATASILILGILLFLTLRTLTKSMFERA
jgi:capsular polysaccharide transport system permease protein